MEKEEISKNPGEANRGTYQQFSKMKNLDLDGRPVKTKTLISKSFYLDEKGILTSTNIEKQKTFENQSEENERT